ncbi:MAG: hypothetical protein KDH97_24635, partial [Calditrichaeota bacterium]|nr:hypothetical protein [Calditrichota bacterium]
GASQSHLLVHLVNYDVTIAGDITPAEACEVELLLPAGKTAQSIAFSGTLGEMQPLEFTSEAAGGQQKVIFNAGPVNVYGLAVVRLK